MNVSGGAIAEPLGPLFSRPGDHGGGRTRLRPLKRAGELVAAPRRAPDTRPAGSTRCSASCGGAGVEPELIVA